MKIERLPEYITIVVTIVCWMFLALYLGAAAGSGSDFPGKLVAVILAVTLALILRSKVWLLIPLCSALAGTIPGLPGGFGVHHGAIIYAFVVFLSLKALKVVRAKPQHDWIDYLLWINLAYLATAYIRNPVGTLGMGFEKIGGKPYLEVIIAFLGYWVLDHVTISSKLAMRMPLLLMVGNIVDGFVETEAISFTFRTRRDAAGTFGGNGGDLEIGGEAGSDIDALVGVNPGRGGIRVIPAGTGRGADGEPQRGINRSRIEVAAGTMHTGRRCITRRPRRAVAGTAPRRHQIGPAERAETHAA